MVEQHEPQERNVATSCEGLNLPLGFRFHPSDMEIVSHYLTNKVRNRDFTCIAIGEVDLNKTEPWDLPDEAKMGEKEWYFFSQKDRKYPTGLRANRATEAGYWKATGRDKEVYNATEGVVLLVGMKKTLVFYKGRAPGGTKTNWVMHEYRLEGSGGIPGPASTSSSTANVAARKASCSSSKDEWVVCRVFEKTKGIKKMTGSVYQVAMTDDEIEQNQNNIPAIPMPLPLSVSKPMQFPILTDFTMDPAVPYYPNIGAGMPSMMPPMVGFGGASGLKINGARFVNPMVAMSPMNFSHKMGMGVAAGQIGMEDAASQMGIGAAACQLGMREAAVQMDIGAFGTGSFDVVVPESSPSLMVSQKDKKDNTTEILSMMSMTSPRSVTNTVQMDGIWN